MKALSTLLCLGMLVLAISCTNATDSQKAVQVLSVEEYAQALQTDTTAYILDVRTPEEYAQGHLDGAHLLNVLEEEAFRQGVKTLSPEHTYYIYCRSGRRSQKAASIMMECGLKVVDLEGGYNAWKEAKTE